MSGSLESLVRYTEAAAGGAANDHDAIAMVRPVDVFAVKAEIERLQAIDAIMAEARASYGDDFDAERPCDTLAEGPGKIAIYLGTLTDAKRLHGLLTGTETEPEEE